MARTAMLGGVLALVLAAEPVWGCQVPNNLINPCGFDTNLLDWQFTGTATREANDGTSALGSANVVAGPSGANSAVSIGSECVAVNINTGYGYGIDVRLISGTPSNCELRVNFFSVPSCGGSAAPTEVIQFTPTAAWGQVSDSLGSGGAAQSANIAVLCTAPAGTAFTMRFDDGFLGAGLEPVELQSFAVE